jgi:hypothetical protein
MSSNKPSTIKIDQVEYVRADSVKKIIYKAKKDGPFNIGKQYFLRSVTHAHVGTLVAVYPTELVLVDASWIADTKRFSNFVCGSPQDGIEVEPFPRNQEVVIGRGALVDAVELAGDFGVQK